MNNGITILPELALNELTAKDMKNVRHFKPPVPGTGNKHCHLPPLCKTKND